MIKDIVWNYSLEYSCWFTTDVGIITCVVIENCGKYLCHRSRCSPHAILRFVSSEAYVRSNFPIVCGCLVVAHLSVIPETCKISARIVDVNAVPLSVMSVVGKCVCLVMMSMIS